MHGSEIDARLTARLDAMSQRLAQIDALLADTEVTSDYRTVRELSVERASLASICDRYRAYRRLSRQHEETQALAMVAGDDELAALAREELPDLESELDDLWTGLKKDLVSSADRAVGSIIMELRAGVGGDEASLWVGDLLSMYRRYAQAKGWRVEDMDFSPGDAGGYPISRNAILFNNFGNPKWRIGSKGCGYH